MSKIHIMDVSLSNMIAAGEVVERPASVVKELIENSLDAKATEIEIKIKDSGRTLIQVTDNGVGMDNTDAKLAFVRHATSKIINERDLFRIKTMGFRGEALPSIAAVSKVIMETSTGIDSGTKIVIENNDIISIEPSASRKGTVIKVEELFYNTPARLKYLKSDSTEYYNVLDVITKLSLANPKVRFKFISNDKKIYLSSGRGDVLEVIKDVYGLETAKNIISFKTEDNDFEVEGFIGKFIISKSSRNYIICIVNGRYVRLPFIQNAVIESYTHYLPNNRYPLAIININVDPSFVDVNVHPSKSEIRLSKIDKLVSLVKKQITSTLETAYMIPEINVNLKNNIEKPALNLESNYEYTDIVNDNLYVNKNDVMENHEQEETYSFSEKINKTKESISLYPIGQIHGTYIVAESIDGFYLIDQHAAMERINFEKFSKLLMENTDLYDLLVPVVVELSLSSMNIVKEKLTILETVGIYAEVFGNNALKINSVPLWMKDLDIKEYVLDIVEQIINNSNINIYSLRSHAIATISCKASLKANKRLSFEEMEILVNTLQKCSNPYTCPHGRPTMIFYSKYEVEKMFKRVG